MKHFLPADCLNLDRTLAEPLQRQLHRQLRALIEQRLLAADSRLPSSRSLAAELGIARNTVVAVYEQLAAEGLVSARHGARAIVLERPDGSTKEVQPCADAAPATRPPADVLDTANFPLVTWSRILARRALQVRAAADGSGDVAGEPALRAVIASYIGAARGVRCTPGQVVVTASAQAARDLLARLLLDPGDAVWMEEPGFAGAQAAFATAGARLQPLSVDSIGWRLVMPAERPKVIYVSPASQRPLGLAMSADERSRLLGIADRLDAFVIEDDFDGDYNFSGRPAPALQGADNSERVIYLGNFDRLLFPALRIGFVVLPERLVAAFRQLQSVTGQHAPAFVQAALADFIEGGHMVLHLRRTRNVYAARRRLFRSLCEDRLGYWLALTEGHVGFSCVGIFRQELDDVAMAAAAQQTGLCVSPLSLHYRHGPHRAGLVMSIGSLSEVEMPSIVERLARLMQSAAGGS